MLCVRMRAVTLLLAWPFLLACAQAPRGVEPELVRIGAYDAGEILEIVSVQASTARAAASSSKSGAVHVLDLADPAAPRLLARYELGLREGEELTSVAFHPRDDLFLAAIQGSGVRAAGRVELRRASDGGLLAVVPCGIGPDAVALSADGRRAAVACEGEHWEFDPATRVFDSPPGSVTLIELGDDPKSARATAIAMPDCAGVAGCVAPSDGRSIERNVDWNDNGAIDAQVDFDGDGRIGDGEVVVGTCAGREVRAKESGGETFLLPLSGGAAVVEPECVAFTADGSRLLVTLQEVNAVALIDTAKGAVVALYGLGTTTHAADVHKDGAVEFDGSLTALREPDGVAVTPDGRWFVTADEGDTEPKLPKVERPGRAGGGRTVSVFEVATGKLAGDTGNQIDAAAERANVYPDARSEAKGSEPEMLTIFAAGGRTLAAVSLERAGGVALVDLGDPVRPRVLSVTGCASAPAQSAKCQPEGVAHLALSGGRHLILTANEGDGTLTVFELRPGA